MASVQNIAAQAQQVVQFIQRQQYAQAEQLLNPLLKVAKKDPQLWYFKALISKAKNANQEVESALKKVLSLAPTHLPAMMLTGQMRQQQGNLDSAADIFIRVTKLAPDNQDAYSKAGICLNQVGKYEKAEQLLASAVERFPEHYNIRLSFGQSLLNQDKDELALSQFEQVLMYRPNYLPALNNKGIALKKLHRWQEAIDCLKGALKHYPEQVELSKNLASCYTFKGEFEQSKQLYINVINNNELDYDAHNWLNKLLWETKDPAFLNSYRQALLNYPDDQSLLMSLAVKQKSAGDIDGARASLETSFGINKAHVPTLVELSKIYRDSKRFDEGLALAQQANKLANQSVQTQEELAKSLLSIGQAKQALSILNKLLKKNPLEQSFLANKAIALKALGSAEYDYLCNYDHVLVTQINVPEGFASLAEFHQELVSTLREYHLTKTNPLDQSLIGGSQTFDKLFDYQVPIFQSLRAAQREQMLAFLARLPKDDKHPVLSRNTGDFIETDSWSVILQNAGFHKNHHHTAGWYSGPYYAKVPESIIGCPQQKGWVKLGEPGLSMVEPMGADKIVQPEEGMMIRFPSYFWHGTNPFESNEERITVPIDLIPV